MATENESDDGEGNLESKEEEEEENEFSATKAPLRFSLLVAA